MTSDKPPEPSRGGPARIREIVMAVFGVLIVVLVLAAARVISGDAHSAAETTPVASQTLASVPPYSLIEPSGGAPSYTSSPAAGSFTGSEPQYSLIEPSTAAPVPTTTDVPTPVPAVDASDLAYITILDSQHITYSTKAAAISAGHSFCDLISAGGSSVQAGLIAMNSGGYSAADAGTIVGDAIGSYCPQYSGR